MAQKQTFELEIPDYLSINHTQYIHALEQSALTNPAAYYKMRGDVIDALGVLMENTFTEYYNMLTKGTLTGKPNQPVKIEANGKSPAIPKQKASAFALRAVEALNEILEEALEMVLPASIQEISRMRLTKIANNTAAIV